MKGPLRMLLLLCSLHSQIKGYGCALAKKNGGNRERAKVSIKTRITVVSHCYQVCLKVLKVEEV